MGRLKFLFWQAVRYSSRLFVQKFTKNDDGFLGKSLTDKISVMDKMDIITYFSLMNNENTK